MKHILHDSCAFAGLTRLIIFCSHFQRKLGSIWPSKRYLNDSWYPYCGNVVKRLRTQNRGSQLKITFLWSKKSRGKIFDKHFAVFTCSIMRLIKQEKTNEY